MRTKRSVKSFKFDKSFYNNLFPNILSKQLKKSSFKSYSVPLKKLKENNFINLNLFPQNKNKPYTSTLSKKSTEFKSSKLTADNQFLSLLFNNLKNYPFKIKQVVPSKYSTVDVYTDLWKYLEYCIKKRVFIQVIWPIKNIYDLQSYITENVIKKNSNIFSSPTHGILYLQLNKKPRTFLDSKEFTSNLPNRNWVVTTLSSPLFYKNEKNFVKDYNYKDKNKVVEDFSKKVKGKEIEEIKKSITESSTQLKNKKLCVPLEEKSKFKPLYKSQYKNGFKGVFSDKNSVSLLNPGKKLFNNTFNEKKNLFLQVLKERKKIRLIYGNLSYFYIKKCLIESKQYKGMEESNFIGLLEKRLDIFLYRISFFKSIAAGREWIKRKRIKVNNRVVYTPSYLLQPGDVVSVIPFHRIEKNPLKIIEENKNLKDLFLYLLSSIFLKKKTLSLSLKSKKHNNFVEKQKINIKEWYVQPKDSMDDQSIKDRKGEYFLLNKRKWLNTVSNFNKEEKVNSFLSLEGKGDKNNKIKLVSYLQKKCNSSIKDYFTFYQNNFPTLKTPSSIYGVKWKPLNVEVSYNLLTSIYLYAPQKVTFPTCLNIPLLYTKI